MWLGSGGVSGLGRVWHGELGAEEVCPGASTQEAGCQGSTLAGKEGFLWHCLGVAVAQGSSHRSSLRDCRMEGS